MSIFGRPVNGHVNRMLFSKIVVLGRKYGDRVSVKIDKAGSDTITTVDLISRKNKIRPGPELFYSIIKLIRGAGLQGRPCQPGKASARFFLRINAVGD